MADPVSMFDKLAQQRQKGKATPPPEPAPEEPKRQRRKVTGKRSDPNYVQVGAYIPKDLNKAVKRSLVEYDGDFSDLVTELLEEWLKRLSD